MANIKIAMISAGLALAIFASGNTEAKTVKYALVVSKETINLSGKKPVDWALSVNGSIPAPTLEFTEGDEAEVVVKNTLKDEEVSIHWHGILLPPEEDGVAYVNTPPILPGKSHVFKFTIRQHGTYWYHSHTALQEQKGVYGAFVIHPKKQSIKVDKEIVAVISDWSDENPDQIIKNLRKDGDYYQYKKNSVRSILGALEAGELAPYLSNEWERMGGMDLSDIGYDTFLINGKNNTQLLVAHPGERVRIRLINAAASSYFYVSLGGTPMTIISADGVDVEPVVANEILIGMAETYDILFTVPTHKNYELRATAQDGTGYASGWIGMGQKIHAKTKAQPNLYAPMDHETHGSQHESTPHQDHGTHGTHEDAQPDTEYPTDEPEHQSHDTSHSNHMANQDNTPTQASVIETLTVDNLRSQEPTTLPSNAKITEFKLVLGGDMARYVWHMNGKTMNEDRDIPINEGEVIRFTFVNDTMMHHPMHLHGHFFRVINQNGERSPLKHTVDVAPHSTRVIEFYANEPGQWMLHCHNLYHMKTGMARVVKYMSYTPSPEMRTHEKHDPHLHDHVYTYGLLEGGTNHAKAHFKLMQTWDELDVELESVSDSPTNFNVDGKWDLEGDLFYRRQFDNFLNVIVGGSAYEKKGYGMLGVGYILPMLIETQWLVSHEGRIRIDVEKRFQWTNHIFTDSKLSWHPEWGAERDSNYVVTLMYGPSWHWAAGLIFTDKNMGVGLKMQL